MKKLLFVVLALQVGVLACKKNNVDPVVANEPTAVVEGTYTITQVTVNGMVAKFTANGVVGQLTFTRTAANQSVMQTLLTDKGALVSDTRLPVYVGGSGGTVDLYADAGRSARVGTATKNTVKLSFTSNGTDTMLEAAR